MPLLSRLHYMLHSGKNSKLCYYVRAYIGIYTPRWLASWRYGRMLRALPRRSDLAYIMQRVDYYNRLTEHTPIDAHAFRQTAVETARQKVTGQKVYYLDSYGYTRSFPPTYKWALLPGDITHVPPVPMVTKSRPLTAGNANSVLMKLDKVRHFLFVHDRKPYREKADRVVFRGLIGQAGGGQLKANRYEFVRRFYGHPLFDVGVIDEEYPEWHTEKMTIGEHLDYKFIMALEGNDVASNLKWVMSSNSVAVMPEPTCETWFMEGTLIPDYHYIRIKPDYSDLEERIAHYVAHPEEAEAIVAHAHEYVAQFRDLEREDIISLLVLRKYFGLTRKAW